jgi:hypothetical protein
MPVHLSDGPAAGGGLWDGKVLENIDTLKKVLIKSAPVGQLKLVN